MPFSHLPALLTSAFLHLCHRLRRRGAPRLYQLLHGLLFARGRRTVTSWFRACGITAELRPAYSALCAAGRRVEPVAATALAKVRPLLPPGRLLVAIDDTPTPRYGPFVEGAGVHHNPSPGPAGERFAYGHVFVTAAALARHPRHGTVALPLLAALYVRRADLPKLPPGRRRPFRTKPQLACARLAWLKSWAGPHFRQLWAVVDGGCAKRPFLDAAREHGFTVVGRLPRNAALRSLPAPRRPGQRGRPAICGPQRLCLARRAGQRRGWQHAECEQYGAGVLKKVKTFVATWRPAKGAIRVVLAEEDDGWRAHFCTDAGATAEEVLEAAADRGAIEQAFKDTKEVWGAGQQQVRNLHSNEACFNLNLWMYSLAEAWAWDKEEDRLVDRGRCPWDSEPRRPSHADKRKALQKQVLRGHIQAALAGRLTKGKVRRLAQGLFELAA